MLLADLKMFIKNQYKILLKLTQFYININIKTINKKYNKIYPTNWNTWIYYEMLYIIRWSTIIFTNINVNNYTLIILLNYSRYVK